MTEPVIEDIYPLSPMQEGMLFEAAYKPNSQAYFIQMDFRFLGKLQKEIFDESWNMLSQRHAVLRSAFTHKETERSLQVVLKERKPEISYIDLSGIAEKEQQKRIKEYRLKDRERGFNLRNDVLMRITVFRLGASQSWFVWSYHHIIIDGWCLGIIKQEFVRIFEALRKGEKPALQPVRPYSEYISWLEKQDWDRAEKFWSGYLSEYDQLATLKNFHNSGKSTDYIPKEINLALDETTSAKLRELAARQHVTLNNVFVSLWGLLLSRYNRAEDVTFGTVVSGRPAELNGVEGMVGLFINAIPVRIKTETNRPFNQLLKAVQKSAFETEPFHYFPLSDIKSLGSLNRELFDHLLIFENYPIKPGHNQSGNASNLEYTIDPMDVHDRTHYDFTIVVNPEDVIGVKLAFNGNVYSEEHIHQVSEHLITLINNVLQSPEQEVGSIRIMNSEERRRVIHEFNDTVTEGTGDSTVLDILNNQVQKIPDNEAVIFNNGHLTYHELNEQTDQLACYLNEIHEIKQNDRVGLLLDRSDKMVVGVLGILKSGGAYVPIDPSYPRERINYMLADSGCKVLVTEEKYLNASELGLQDSGVPSIDMRNIPEQRDSRPDSKISPNHLAYVIYTSGSTGKPKGCQVEHGNLIHYLKWASEYYFKDGEGGNFGLYSSLSFDLTVTSLFLPLLRGKTLRVFSSEAELGDILLENFHESNGIDSIKLTPTHISLLKQTGIKTTNIRLALVGGEALYMDQVRFLHELNPAMEVYNEYGPTETTVGCIVKKVEPSDHRVLIGKPIDNTQIYILDQNLRPATLGMAGEIYIGGSGVSRGYINLNELNAEKFIESPFNEGGRLYKTGDMGFWHSDGNIELIGRNDDQVKIRGYRIELGEIESRLLETKDVAKAVVIARDFNGGAEAACSNTAATRGTEKELVAYVEADNTLNVNVLREQLKVMLPDHMIPSYFVRLDSLPVTSNGKIDKKALPDPSDQSIKSSEYAAPRNELEEQMASIWKEVLKIEKIGIHDSFFELGGHSLKAMQIVSRVHRELSVELSLNELFSTPTIAQLTKTASDRTPGEFLNIIPVAKQEYYEISNAQRRIWVIEQFEEGQFAYNIPSAFVFKGPLNIDAFNGAFKTIIERHEIIRTNFISVGDRPVQIVHDSVDFKIDVVDISDKADREELAVKYAAEHASIPFDLTSDILLKVRLLKLEEKKYVALCNMHHIISDGWSMEVLVKELLTLYRTFDHGKPSSLPPVGIQYKDYAAWQNNLLKADEIKHVQSYWHEKLSGKIPVLNLPTDYPRPALKTYNGNVLHCQINSSSAKKLVQFCKEEESTTFMAFLALVKVLMFRYTGQKDIVIGSPIAGRNHHDLEDQIGFYVNTLVLRDRIDEKDTFKTFLKKVKQTTVDAYKHQIYPFDKLVDELEVERDVRRSPLFDIGVSMQKEEQSELKFEEIEVVPLETQFNISKFDLTFIFFESEDEIYLTIEYNTDLFNEQRINRIWEHFQELLINTFADPQQCVADVNLLTEKEKHQLLFEFNDTKAGFPKETTIAKLFEEQAENTPDKVAIVYQDKELTYGELNEKANRLAHYLKNHHKIQPNDLVGILLNKSEWTVIAALGILKAGGAYVPIDPTYPENRVLSMLSDCNIQVLLTDTPSVKNHFFTNLQNLQLLQIQPHLTAPRPQIADFNGHPIPDRSLVNYEKYYKYIGLAMVKHSISMQASRGCPYLCTYCHDIWPKSHVIRSAENFFEELRQCYGLGIKRFVIIDDIFNLDRKNSARFFELIIENGLKVQLLFPNGLRGDILTEEYIDLMVEAGTISLALALETASPRLQKKIKKNLKLEKFRKNIEYLCKKHPQVILELFSMHGFPSETEEEARATLDFIKSIKWLHFPYFHILKIFPRSEMAKQAVESGISLEAIDKSVNLAYHELPDTLPFDKNFTIKYQTEFVNEYFMSKERLLYVLPFQMKVLTEDEILQKYNSYLPVEIKSFSALLELVGITEEELGTTEFFGEDKVSVINLNEKLSKSFPKKVPAKNALKILLLDLSQFFSSDTDMLYDVVEPPLGLMYLLTYLNEQFGEKINGKVAKSRIDFDSFEELKILLDDFKPEVIGLRTLSFYKNFFHQAVALMKQWKINVPIITGGPYATSDYSAILQDRNVDLVVMGEGEETFSELIEKIMENGGQLPEENILCDISGITFVKEKTGLKQKYAREIIMLDELTEILPKKPAHNLDIFNQASDLLYIIFTSGSSGKPKGCRITHENVVRLIKNDKHQFDFSENDVWIMAHSFCFDFSVWEMYGALLNGGKLIIPDSSDVRDVAEFLKKIKQHRITVLNQTPSAFYSLINQEMEEDGNTLHEHLRYVILGGDKLEPAKLKHWVKSYPLDKISLINMYGITETTVHVSFCRIKNQDVFSTGGISPIGSPITETQVYIFDNNLNIVPVGVMGELYIGGTGVCRGYLNRPELTAKRFIENPFSPGDKLYKTGDTARWWPDGNLEFLGRNDEQVKIRGYRIELGEVENCLFQISAIKDAIVLCRQDNDGLKYLCAYVILKDDICADDIKNEMARTLPNYMIPSFFVFLEAFPVTQNGKVDKKALAVKEIVQAAGKEKYCPPETETEKQLALIWEEMFEKNEISVIDNFFELGGHSLNAVKLASLVHKRLDVVLPINIIFKAPTIRELAKYILELVRFGVEEIDDALILLNGQKKESFSGCANRKIIFAFPPAMGDATHYLQLAQLLKSHDFYSFNYIEAKDGLDDYINLINDVDSKGPYVFLGHSAGGNLAYEVAHELKKLGKTVSDIVMVDASRRLDKMSISDEEIRELSLNFLDSEYVKPYMTSSVLKEKALLNIRSYYDYLMNNVDNHTVDANIRLVVCENSKDFYSDASGREVVSKYGWADVTQGEFKIYQAVGDHNQLLQPPYLDTNAKLISGILDSLLSAELSEQKGE